MKKLFATFLGLLVAANVAFAEQSGWFVGAQLGMGSVKDTYTQSTNGTIRVENSSTRSGFRYGGLAGYKLFFSENFGVRLLAMFNLGDMDTAKSKDWHASIDLLYNVIDIKEMPLGVFLGAGTGYASFSDPLYDSLEKTISSSSFVNNFHYDLGLRLNLNEHHSLEAIYWQSFTHNSARSSVGNQTTEKDFHDLNFIGLRYIYTF